MKNKMIILMGTSLFFLSLVVTGSLWAGGDGHITIESPKDEEVIGGHKVKIKFEQIKEGRADHVHIFVDGKLAKPLIGKNETTINISRKGSHEITVRAATANHNLLDVKDSVTIEIK
ncbi:MAG: hypothetical protein ACE5EA_09675 [Nitrospirota bacterium]